MTEISPHRHVGSIGSYCCMYKARITSFPSAEGRWETPDSCGAIQQSEESKVMKDRREMASEKEAIKRLMAGMAPPLRRLSVL